MTKLEKDIGIGIMIKMIHEAWDIVFDDCNTGMRA